MQIVGDEAHAGAIPEDQLDPVRSLRPANVNRAGEWIASHLRLDQRSQSFGALALMWCTTLAQLCGDDNYAEPESPMGALPGFPTSIDST